MEGINLRRIKCGKGREISRNKCKKNSVFCPIMEG